MEISFTIPGEPCAKGRPRFSRCGPYVNTYTPEKTTNFETLVKYEYYNQCGNMRFADNAQIAIDIIAYRSIPKNTSKKKRALMCAEKVVPITKPDWDNIGKIVSDALNGLAYRDDSQIADSRVRKMYSEEPRTEVRIWEF